MDSMVTPPAQRRLLVVLAHPDDESFGMGGTLARYADEGVDVHGLQFGARAVAQCQDERQAIDRKVASLFLIGFARQAQRLVPVLDAGGAHNVAIGDGIAHGDGLLAAFVLGQDIALGALIAGDER